MKKFLPFFGILLCLTGGILLAYSSAWYFSKTHTDPNTNNLTFGLVPIFFIGIALVYFLLKMFFPEFISNEEHRAVFKPATRKRWIILIIIIFVILSYLAGVE
ncbi:hypothetical protein A3G55_02690 [Candidatus Giovannonibacteria bacterium RIFCSPLOWO2_12_FULL_44_25]|uniref:Uncharacterized protein n=3 Tax=Candidatus Giovannoniibacteriota TaxID=1752738 RepID=A0A0G1IE04_9BACT|nr:MAG: hypothetical protein UW15_C0014G0002 [Parcubacteria group bacterium GW2011_GWC1_44_10]KKT57058.1 MAG: hypothetical protein UW49_C0008G0020 [Candidatus Giovannonibacteria bacterium GW2011_GWB1_44_23]KKT59495.1 MAG: hypothetical protein UW53_C0011G0024 [Candidatus Giovannonibacteria bacterium GW2011_GWA1_44_25]OGF49944.1 MAG: hypothetical protein A2120_04515 [Candidatus Giovannonibacteria bacterium GWA2_45_15]OGF60578.1 MAG: hypothetical protein A2656_00675 [Candidatus Giovannonibacteria 